MNYFGRIGAFDENRNSRFFLVSDYENIEPKNNVTNALENLLTRKLKISTKLVF